MAVDFTQSDGVGLLTLAQPDRLNPMNDATWSAMDALLDELEAGPSGGLRALVVTGAGRVFSAGGDINRMRAVLTSGRSEEEFRRSELARLRRIAASLVRFVRLPVVRVAAVNHCAVGAGLALACACDYRIIDEDGFLDTSFGRLGLPGDTGITHFLPQLIGPHRARDWLLRPRRIPAPQALSLGLVDEVVPAPQLLPRAHELATQYAQASPPLLRSVHHLVDTLPGLEPALEAEAQATVTCKLSPEHRAAVTAFLNHRARR